MTFPCLKLAARITNWIQFKFLTLASKILHVSLQVSSINRVPLLKQSTKWSEMSKAPLHLISPTMSAVSSQNICISNTKPYSWSVQRPPTPLHTHTHLTVPDKIPKCLCEAFPNKLQVEMLLLLSSHSTLFKLLSGKDELPKGPMQ